jgi:hypothetical protein
MFKTRSYILANAIVNHPDIRPTLESGSQYLDSRELISDPDNLVYAGEEGIVIFTFLRPGLFRGHIGLLAHARGKAGLAAASAVLDDMATRFESFAVVAGVPLQLRAARWFCKMLGFVTKTIDAEQEWMVYEGGSHGRHH